MVEILFQPKFYIKEFNHLFTLLWIYVLVLFFFSVMLGEDGAVVVVVVRWTKTRRQPQKFKNKILMKKPNKRFEAFLNKELEDEQEDSDLDFKHAV